MRRDSSLREQSQTVLGAGVRMLGQRRTEEAMLLNSMALEFSLELAVESEQPLPLVKI
jgi:hypothetical protein